jgi:hypothetical protein
LGWESKFEEVAGRVVCSIGIWFGEAAKFAWKSDGAGDTDHEAEKGGLSDAFKRAAVHWGIGRYLYRLDSPWVAIEQAGKSYKIAESERGKLMAVLGGPGKPASARGGNGAGDVPASAPPSPTGAQEPARGKTLKERCMEIAAAYDGAPDIDELNKLEARLRAEIAAMPDKAKSMLAVAFHRNREALAPLSDIAEAIADLEGREDAPRQTLG